MNADDIHQLTEELREAFDASFQIPVDTGGDDGLDALLVRAGDKRCAIPLAELAGIRRCPKPTPLPSEDPGLVGLVGVRGELVTVVTLSAMHGKSVAACKPVWLLLVAGANAIGLSCSTVEGYRRLNRAGIAQVADDGSHRLGVYRDAQATIELFSVTSWIQSWSAADAVAPDRSDKQ